MQPMLMQLNISREGKKTNKKLFKGKIVRFYCTGGLTNQMSAPTVGESKRRHLLDHGEGLLGQMFPKSWYCQNWVEPPPPPPLTVSKNEKLN